MVIAQHLYIWAYSGGLLGIGKSHFSGCFLCYFLTAVACINRRWGFSVRFEWGRVTSTGCGRIARFGVDVDVLLEN